MIYLDNAATTFPKPRRVLEKMVALYEKRGVSPGRGGYDLAVEAEEAVSRTRAKLAALFNAPDPDRVVFCHNATAALNMAIRGLIRPGGHVVSTRLEHNSVLRPLHHWQEAGVISYDLVGFDGRGFIDPEEVERAMTKETCLVVMTHASNVLGTVQPVAQVGRICADRGVPLVVDAAQSAGVAPMDLQSWQAAAVAFTGHKSMLGPTGTGGLVVVPGVDIKQSLFGGTGIDSKNLIHTPDYPFRLEAGTLNVMGIFGLEAALDYLADRDAAAIHEREMTLWNRLREGLASIRGVTLYCAEPSVERVALLTFNLERILPQDAGDILDGDFQIAARVGLHCAPLVHQSLGTQNRGAVRFSLGPFNTREEIDRAVRAVEIMALRAD